MIGPHLPGGPADNSLLATLPSPPDNDIVAILEGYRGEAELARRSGPNGRDATWERNLDLYWNRYDFSGKAAWQSQETMPEVPAFVDRFAAALKEALVVSPDGFYTVIDPTDTERDMVQAVKRMMDVWLSRCGTGVSGRPIAFPAVFEEQTKLGALMSMSALVTWRDNRVVVDSIDPRHVWLDHTGRNLYRIRRVEIDKHELEGLGKMREGGKALYDASAIAAMTADIEERAGRMALTGVGEEISSSRVPITLDEYRATIIGRDGKVIAAEALAIVGNEKWLLRGPEANPFWHGEDWLVFAPPITVPLAPYGRSYMEDFACVATAFNELTNLILDAVYFSSIRAFALIPEMLADPSLLATGITPGKMFPLEMGMGGAKDFMEAIDLGSLPPESIQVWSALKNELREAAGLNEVALGQFAPKGRTSATEIASTQRSSVAIVRSVAETIETRFLDPMLDLVWKTGLQHMGPKDAAARAAGPEMFGVMRARRKELIRQPITFQARGISKLIERQQTYQALVQLLGVVAQNELLLQQFMQMVDVKRLIELLFELSGVDMKRLQATERELMIRQITQPLQAAGEKVGAMPNMVGVG